MVKKYTSEKTEFGRDYFEDGIPIFPAQFWDIIKKLERECREQYRNQDLLRLEAQSWKSTVRELREHNEYLEKENRKLVAALEKHKDDTIFSDDKKQVVEREREIYQDRKMPGWMKSGRFA